MYAQVHQGNSWQWHVATGFERIGRVNYNVFLEDRQRLIRSHTNQLKQRAAESVPDRDENQGPSPLSIFFDGFGLDVPSAAVQATATNPDPSIPQNENDLSLQAEETDESQYYTEGNDEEDEGSPPQLDPAPVPSTPLARERRQIRLPARFEPYWMT